MRSEELDTKTVVSQEHSAEVNGLENEHSKIVKGNPLTRLMRSITTDPDLSIQLIVIFLTLASDNMRMDRRIDTMTAKVDAVRNISEVLTNTMRSLKTAAQAPEQIRRLLE
jgi:hypothetical protein